LRFSYKPIVQRFNIPRPTLIEWKKRVKSEPNNWRVQHLAFLQNQIILEKETLLELSKIGFGYEEIFLFSICLYLEGIEDFIPKTEFKVVLKNFAYTKQDSVEFRHDFAKEIWNLELKDESGRYIADYYRLYDLLDRLTSFQYYILFVMVMNFIKQIRTKIDIGYSDGFVGKTWQELFSLQKEFSHKSIKLWFHNFF